jgi:hypothetical protein
MRQGGLFAFFFFLFFFSVMYFAFQQINRSSLSVGKNFLFPPWLNVNHVNESSLAVG